MSTNKRESGFGVVEAVVALVAFVAIGFGGWYLWQRNQEKDSSSAQQTTSPSNEDASPTPADKRFPILEWGIYAKNESNYDLQYKISGDERYAYFTAAELVSATSSEACGIGMVDNVQMSGGGRIARYTAEQKTAEYPDMTSQALAAYYDKDATLKDLYVKTDTHYYFYIPPQGACSDEAIDLQNKVNAAVKGLLPTLSTKN